MLSLLAVTSAAFAQDIWPTDVSSAWKTTQEGKNDAALVIAIEDYDYVSDVPGAGQAGRDWESFLLDHRSVPATRVLLLRDEYATRELIEEKATRLAGRVRPGGMLWVVFVGHGAPTRKGEEGLLVGADTRQTASSPECARSASIGARELDCGRATDGIGPGCLLLGEDRERRFGGRAVADAGEQHGEHGGHAGVVGGRGR